MAMKIPHTLLNVTDLGQMGYASALRLQYQAHQRVLDRTSGPTLLLVEHDPVITITRHHHSRSHLLASPQWLAQQGIEVIETDRGGDITYHGPGQLVAYAILRLNALRLNVGRYIHWLEQVVIDAMAVLDICAFRIDGLTGVWVDVPNSSSPKWRLLQPAKLCALGVRVERGITLHGIALNVTTRLAHFKTIVPCGLADRSVTSIQKLLGSNSPSMDRVKQVLVATMQDHLTSLRPSNHASLAL